MITSIPTCMNRYIPIIKLTVIYKCRESKVWQRTKRKLHQLETAMTYNSKLIGPLDISITVENMGMI